MMSLKRPENECSDPDCPFHGSLAVRGRVMEGEVVSDRMEKTTIIKSITFQPLRM